MSDPNFLRLHERNVEPLFCYSETDHQTLRAPAIQVTADLILALMPVKLVWHLRLPLRKKILMASLMAGCSSQSTQDKPAASKRAGEIEPLERLCLQP